MRQCLIPPTSFILRKSIFWFFSAMAKDSVETVRKLSRMDAVMIKKMACNGFFARLTDTWIDDLLYLEPRLTLQKLVHCVQKSPLVNHIHTMAVQLKDEIQTVAYFQERIRAGYTPITKALAHSLSETENKTGKKRPRGL